MLAGSTAGRNGEEINAMQKYVLALNTLNPTIAAALIAAAATIVLAIFGMIGFFVREFVISPRKQKKVEELNLLSERFTKIYSPLMFHIGGGELEHSKLLTSVDPGLMESIKSNLHLLSPSLRKLLVDYVALGEKKEDGKTHYRLDDAEEVINIHRKFRPILIDEYNQLLKKLEKPSQK